MDEYMKHLEHWIKTLKQSLIHDAEGICISLDSTVQQLKTSLDDPTDYVVNSLGELQANAAIFNANCGALGMQVRIYNELKKTIIGGHLDAAKGG